MNIRRRISYCFLWKDGETKKAIIGFKNLGKSLQTVSKLDYDNVGRWGISRDD